VRISTEYQFCRKCNKQLRFVMPSMTMHHCGTDFWTQHGERRWRPTICMGCRSKVGAKAQRAQNSGCGVNYKSSLQSTQEQTILED